MAEREGPTTVTLDHCGDCRYALERRRSAYCTHSRAPSDAYISEATALYVLTPDWCPLKGPSTEALERAKGSGS
jgi:hypothetical protein